MSTTFLYQGGQQSEKLDFSALPLSNANYRLIKTEGGSDEVIIKAGQWVIPGSGFDSIRGIGIGLFGVSYADSPAGIDIRADWGRTENDGWGHQDQLLGINAFIGSAFNDSIRGTGKNEQFGAYDDPSKGNDSYYGGGGYDVVVYSGKASDFRISNQDGATLVTESSSGFVDRLESISQLQFADKTIDLQTPTSSGYLIYLSEGIDSIDKQTMLPSSQYTRWGDLYALAGDDEIRWAHGNVFGGAGNDRIIGIEANANTWAQYGNSPGPVLINLKEGFALDGWGTRDSLVNINRVSGSWAYADTIIGTDADDELWTTWGGDLIVGGSGNDLVHHWNGDRRPLSLSYNDSDKSYTLRWGAQPEAMAILRDVERIQEDLPGSSRTIVLANASIVKDQIFDFTKTSPGARPSLAKGGDGADQFYLGDQQWADPGAGFDLVRGVGKGVFGIRFDSSPAGVVVRADWGRVENDGYGQQDLIQGINAFFGGPYNDSIRGSNNDEFFGSSNDVSKGNDTYVGGGGFDVVRYPGNASDYRIVSNDNDGSVSVEHLKSTSVDRLEQIASIQFKDRTVELSNPGRGNEQRWGSESADSVYRPTFYLGTDNGYWNDIYGGGGDDDIRWTSGNIFGGPGRDTLTILGNAGSGWVSYGDSPSGVFVDLQNAYAIDGWGDRDSLVNVTNVGLSNHRDTVFGTSGDDQFWDSWGGDSIDAGAGSDTFNLWGGDKSPYSLSWQDIDQTWILRWRAESNGFIQLKNFETLQVNYPNGRSSERINLFTVSKTPVKTVKLEAGGPAQNTGAGDDQIILNDGAWAIPSKGFDQIIGQGVGRFGIRFDDSPSAVNVRADWGRVENDGWGYGDLLLGVNAFVGSPYNDYIHGTWADEQFGSAAAYTQGNDSYVGGGGYDSVVYFGQSAEYRVDYDASSAKGSVTHLSSGRVDTIEQIAIVRFSDQSKILTMPGRIADAVYGGNDNDRVNKKELLSAQFYRDWIDYDGGPGNDSIEWTNGNIVGGPGDDRIVALEQGSDLTVSYSDSPSGVFINLSEGYALDGWGGRDTFINVTRVNTSGFRDTVIGSPGNDEFWDSWGGDTIDGAGGNDLFHFWIGDKANYTVSYNPTTDAYVLRWRADSNAIITLKNIESIRENNHNNQWRMLTLAEMPKLSDQNLDYGSQTIGSARPLLVKGLSGSDFVQILPDQWIEASSGFDHYRGIGQGLFGLRFDQSPSGVVVRSDWGRVENDGWGHQDRLEGINAFFGSPFNDEIRGNWVDDRFGSATDLSKGNDSYWGSGGYDTVFYPGASSDYQISGDLSNGTTLVRHVASGKVDSLQEIESIVFPDRSITYGEPGFNQGRIWGSSADDSVVQTQFYDLTQRNNPWFDYEGGSGNDQIQWSDGNITGGPGNDVLTALTSNVRVSFADSPSAVLVDLKAGYALDGWGSRDRLVNIYQIDSLSQYADTLIGSDQDDRIWASSGGDTLDGGGGFDVLEYWAGNNQAYSITYTDDLSFTLRWRSDSTSYIVLKNFEGIRINHHDPTQRGSVLLSELVNWSEQAPKALMGAQLARWNASSPLGSASEVSYSFMTTLPAYGSGGQGEGFQALGTQQQQQIRQMMQEASNIAGIVFKEVSDSAAAQIRIGSNQQKQTQAYSFSPDASQGALAGDIWIDLESLTTLKPGDSSYWATLQALGHALGLRKPLVYGEQASAKLEAGQSLLTQAVNDMSQTVMSNNFGLTPVYPSRFGILDSLALQRIYGPPKLALGAGDDVYRIGDDQGTRILTLIDSGGRDRIDMSELSFGALLDLKPNGTGSAGISPTGYLAVNNVYIHPDTIIEELVGSSHDDVLLGNSADNLIYPGLGNDFINGESGFDTLVIDSPRATQRLSTGLATGSHWLEDIQGTKGSKQFESIERIIFNDGRAVRFDFDSGAGRDAALLIGAFLGPNSVRDQALFGVVVNYLEQGASVKSGIELLVKSGFIAIITGQSSDRAAYEYIYKNTQGTQPVQNVHGSGTDFQKQSQFVEALMYSAENGTRINLTGLIESGLDYFLV